jgi:predicted alpha/beta-hydrolase family hydrolase
MSSPIIVSLTLAHLRDNWGMAARIAESLVIDVNHSTRVSGLLAVPPKCRMALVLAHGAGAGMDHPSMAAIADGLYQRDVATLRYQFPYMEQHSGRPDPPPLCHATVRAAVSAARVHLDTTPLLAGGRSFGGRMTSQAQALEPLPGVRGLAFFAFPLHLAKKPADTRAAHLDQVHIPMLFLQGTRDELADLSLMRPLMERLQPRATMEVLEHADHSFNVLVRSGRTNAEVRDQLLDAFVAWAVKLAA